MGEVNVRIRKIKLVSFAWNFTLVLFFLNILLCIFLGIFGSFTAKLFVESLFPGTNVDGVMLIPFYTFLVLFPFVISILNFLFGLLLGLIINFSLHISKGLKTIMEETEEVSHSYLQNSSS